MNRRRCWLIALLATLGLLVGPLPAYAAPQTLVAVGDSFASGVGSFVYYNDGTDCYRSPFSYPSQLAAATRLPLTLLACSGATTADVLNEQVPLIPEGADLVTVTVGGNDIGYRPVLTTCALPGWLGNCDAAIDAARDPAHRAAGPADRGVRRRQGEGARGQSGGHRVTRGCSTGEPTATPSPSSPPAKWPG